MKNKDAEKFVKSLPTGEPESQSVETAIRDALLLEKTDKALSPSDDKTMVSQGYSELDTRPQLKPRSPGASTLTMEGYDELADAFAVIKEHIRNGGSFSNAQLDIGIEMSLAVLPPPDQALFREVAQHNNIPLWQALWGQFRRCNEWGVAFTPILEPGWSSTEGVKTLEPRACPICQTVFQPNDWGQVFCTDKCGAEDERRKRDARLAEEQRERLATLERMRRATPEPDVKGTEFSRPPEVAGEDPLITPSRLDDEEVPAGVLE